MTNARRTQIAAAVLLGLATLATSWSTFQSSLWDNIQLFRLAEAGAAGRASSEADVLAGVRRAVEGALFRDYLLAKQAGDEVRAQRVFQLFRPETQAAVSAWEREGGLTGPIRLPFDRPEYRSPEHAEAVDQRELEQRLNREAHEANSISDRYLMLTLIAALVLFLAGIATTFEYLKVSVTILILSAVILVILAIFLIQMPVTGPD